MKLRALTIFLILALAVFSGCSKDDSSLHAPVYYDGKISISNQSGVRIRLLEFTQTRGEQEYSYLLDRSLHSGFEFFFKNMLDGGDSDIFPGGDAVFVHYIADIPDPEYPSRPLFTHTIGHTINGVVVYYIKAGGHFSLSP